MVLQVGFNDLRSLLISCEDMILYLSTLAQVIFSFSISDCVCLLLDQYQDLLARLDFMVSLKLGDKLRSILCTCGVRGELVYSRTQKNANLTDTKSLLLMYFVPLKFLSNSKGWIQFPLKCFIPDCKSICYVGRDCRIHSADVFRYTLKKWKSEYNMQVKY